MRSGRSDSVRACNGNARRRRGRKTRRPSLLHSARPFRIVNLIIAIDTFAALRAYQASFETLAVILQAARLLTMTSLGPDVDSFVAIIGQRHRLFTRLERVRVLVQNLLNCKIAFHLVLGCVETLNAAARRAAVSLRLEAVAILLEAACAFAPARSHHCRRFGADRGRGVGRLVLQVAHKLQTRLARAFSSRGGSGDARQVWRQGWA
mmetsp:Transcript_3535/g.9751  ORF Transcript_3535/g.9751 Transcript_3535/m.9751 type:complete len:207 (+) Transcript_3535:1281-1901(+)